MARSAVDARRHIRQALDSWGLTTLCDTALLLTSELVTNSLLHARTELVLRIDRAGADGVRIAIADASPVTPTVRHHSDTATTGRGLQLVEQLADDWSTDVTDMGKTIWFLLSRGRDPWAGFHAGDWTESS